VTLSLFAVLFETCLSPASSEPSVSQLSDVLQYVAEFVYRAIRPSCRQTHVVQ
jgi:hypothetical protein